MSNFSAQEIERKYNSKFDYQIDLDSQKNIQQLQGNSQTDSLQQSNQHNICSWINFSYQSFTFAITIVILFQYFMCLIFYFKSEVQTNESWNCILLYTGGKYQPSIKYYFQFFRLITPIFLHNSLFHLLGNLVFLIFLGFNLESYYYSFKYAIIYFLSGIGASLLSCSFYPSLISVGASGALFGLFALQIAYFYETREKWNEKKAGIIIFVIIFIWNLIFTFIGENIDIGAHLGGFCVGLLSSALLTNAFSNLGKSRIMILLLLLYFFLTILFTFLLSPVNSKKLALLELGCAQLFYGDFEQ